MPSRGKTAPGVPRRPGARPVANRSTGPARQTGLTAAAGRRIALIAHDHTQDMLERAGHNLGLLAGHELFATAPAGRLLHEQLEPPVR